MPHARRLVPLAGGALLLSLAVTGWLSPSAARPGPEAANVAALLEAQHGLEVDPASMLLFRPAGALRWQLRPREAYFLARPRCAERAQREGAACAEPRDLFFAHVVLSDRGIPVHASPVFALTRTSLADEQELRYDGQRYLAVAAAVEGKTQVVTVFDLDGVSKSALGGFSASQQVQQRLTNWQETGRLRGIDRLEVRLNVARPLRLAWRDGLLHASGDGGAFSVVVDPRRGVVLRGPARAEPVRIGKRSFIAWAVDTVRGLSFVGPEKIAWLEDRVYGVVDRARRFSGSSISAGEIRDEMALPVVAAAGSSHIPGWPPPPLKPMLPGPLKGEGAWLEVKGPFLRAQPGLPSFFAMSFLRPDAERLFARVYFVAWDPRRLELRMVGGTAEPRSATGELGRGMIPRDEKLLPRLVAAFNGGFQSMHGDFGMMEERREICPPKPWAATVARLADGATGFGTWDGKAKAGWVPEWIDSFRQNLTPLVEDGVFNPWKRGSWGGGAGFLTGSGPTAQIIRSGICLHRSGHLMFVLGNPVDGPTLGKAMQKAGCDYGMELDINSGHVGFEFFNVLRPEESAPPFVEEKYFQRSGTYPGVEKLRYFMREVVRGTGNSPVPRYTGREARDFLYLVTRELLPPPPLPSPPGRSEGRWTSAALPAEAVSFPPAASRTLLGQGAPGKERRIHLLALDTRWLEATLCLPRGEAGCLATSGEKPVAVLPLGAFGAGRALLGDGKQLLGTPGGAPSLVLGPRRPEGAALPSVNSGPERSTGSISIQGAAAVAAKTPAGRPQAALCTASEGVLLYASGLGASPGELGAALGAAGCKRTVYLGSAEPLVLVDGKGAQTIFGEVLPPVASTASLVFRRGRTRWGARIFTHVKPQPRSIWTAVQPERTRASALRHATRAAVALGLPPPKNLEELCKPPYAEVKELKQYRWRDPQNGVICGGAKSSGSAAGKIKETTQKRRRRTPQ